jgi:hypothetical protein
MPTTAESTPPSASVGRPPGVVRIRSSCACVGRTRLHYRVAGDGPPLVLVHDYGAASSWWRHTMGPLAEQRRVSAPDLGGFGRSWPKHQFSLERTVECLAIPRARRSRPPAQWIAGDRWTRTAAPSSKPRTPCACLSVSTSTAFPPIQVRVARIVLGSSPARSRALWT